MGGAIRLACEGVLWAIGGQESADIDDKVKPNFMEVQGFLSAIAGGSNVPNKGRPKRREVDGNRLYRYLVDRGMTVVPTEC